MSVATRWLKPRAERTRSKKTRPKSYVPRVEALEDRCLLSVDAVLFWNNVMLNANAVDHGLAAPDQGGPTRTARAFAIVHAAIFDSVNVIFQEFESYATNRNGQKGASPEAAVAAAAHTTLAALFPQQRTTFDAALTAFLAGVPDGPAENKGVALGRSVAHHLLAMRRHDGSADPMPYTPGTNPGDHNVDPLHPNQGFLDPLWGKVDTFAIPNIRDFLSPPPPALTSAAYTAAFNEVRVLGAVDAETADRDLNLLPDRTPEQTVIGIYWGYDGSPGLGTPPRLYNQIAQVVATQQGNTMYENARLFALINIAMADAGIQCWDTKYEYEFWRPILGIMQADMDGNPDTAQEATWTPLGAPRSNDPGGTNFTPPFPAYTSGHATFGAAMFRMLANFYGTDNITFSFMSDEFNGVTRDQDGSIRPIVSRTFTSFSQAAEENGQSRIYLGIHWSFDKVFGIQAGNSIADFIFGNLLRPRSSSSGAARAAGVASFDGPGDGSGVGDNPDDSTANYAELLQAVNDLIYTEWFEFQNRLFPDSGSPEIPEGGLTDSTMDEETRELLMNDYRDNLSDRLEIIFDSPDLYAELLSGEAAGDIWRDMLLNPRGVLRGRPKLVKSTAANRAIRRLSSLESPDRLGVR